jgi:hypothetical protein
MRSLLTGLRPKDSFVAASLIVMTACLVFAASDLVRYHRDDVYVRGVAEKVVREAGATDTKSKVVALRDYLRSHVDNEGLAGDGSGRPFLRSGAADTLRTGKGLCGEVSRAMIVMASDVGIRAQRVNLYGQLQHVVAEVEIAPHQYVIVDAQNPPQIEDLETLDKVILRPEYDDYSTLNLRRLHLQGFVPRLKLDMSFLTLWLERPNLIKATLFLLAAFLALSGIIMRFALRGFLHQRGWVHHSDEKLLKRHGLVRRNDHS